MMVPNIETVGKPLEVSSTTSMTSSELVEPGLANGSATVKLNSEDFGDIDELVMHEVSANVGRPSELYSQW